MKTHQLLVFGTAALSVVLSTSRTDANESALGVSSDSTCATYPYVNIGYGEVNPFGTCSGNGECVQTNVTGSIMPEYQCVCAEGWTGRSDWINGDGYDCGVNISAVQAMWGINLLITLVLVVKSVPFIQHRLENTRRFRETLKKKGRRYSMIQNRGLMAVYAVFGICIPAQIIMCIYRIVDTDARVGLDVFATILFCVFTSGVHIMGWLFSPALLATVLRGHTEMHWLIRINDRFALVLAILAICFGLLPIVNLVSADENGVQNENVNIATFEVYMLGVIVQMICYAVQNVIVGATVLRVLTKSHSMTGRPEMLLLRQRLCDTQREGARQAVTQSLIYLILFLFPMLWTKHDYSLPLTWIAVPILAFKIAKSADTSMKVSKSGSGNSRRKMSELLGSKVKLENNTANMGTWGNTEDEEECYELKADGRVLSGKNSYENMDSAPLVGIDHAMAVSSISSYNPTFEMPSFMEDPKPSGL